MNILRLSTLSLTLAVMTLGYVNPASSEGFLLTQADAAHADWIDTTISGCRVDLAVGFVEAKSLQNPLGSRPIQPHSDVAATLTVQCPSGMGPMVTLMGVTPAAGCAPPPDMVSLDSALVSCVIDFVDDTGMSDVEITGLHWTATGDVFTEIINNPGMHAAHRTRTASVDAGSVIIMVDDVAGLPTFIELFAAGVDFAQMTHYNEIQQ